MKIKDGRDLFAARQEEVKELVNEDLALWKQGDYGKNPLYKKRASVEESKQLQNSIQGPDALKAISLKLPPSLLEDLKGLAEEDNIGYQTYIKVILSRYVREEKRKQKPA